MPSATAGPSSLAHWMASPAPLALARGMPPRSPVEPDGRLSQFTLAVLRDDKQVDLLSTLEVLVRVTLVLHFATLAIIGSLIQLLFAEPSPFFSDPSKFHSVEVIRVNRASMAYVDIRFGWQVNESSRIYRLLKPSHVALDVHERLILTASKSKHVAWNVGSPSEELQIAVPVGGSGGLIVLVHMELPELYRNSTDPEQQAIGQGIADELQGKLSKDEELNKLSVNEAGAPPPMRNSRTGSCLITSGGPFGETCTVCDGPITAMRPARECPVCLKPVHVLGASCSKSKMGFVRSCKSIRAGARTTR